MPSIPVISHNVIRQALDWHDLPKPAAVTTLDNFRFPSGKSQATVALTFDTTDLLKRFTLTGIQTPNDYGFQFALQQCFCSDIVVCDIIVDAKMGVTEALLSCTLEPHDQ